MPRADPTRSDYCASRHLLRNLDDPAELRRNPLSHDYFPPADGIRRRRGTAADAAAAERVRDDVRTALARCAEFARDRSCVALGRMHAVLLRCEIDDRPPHDVAEELGVSERQLRRERRAAHDTFARAFRAAPREVPAPARVSDVAAMRVAEAVELHELGQGVLAQSALASIAARACAPGRQIGALCLAAELEFDALRHAAAAAHLADARALIVRHARDLDDEAARAADEHVDFVAWLLRWQTAISPGLAMQPPIALLRSGDDRAREESRRALFVRAAAAYAMQRWEVGDYPGGCAVVARALGVVPTLHPACLKERLAVMLADTQLYALRARPGDDRDRFVAIETLAASHGHVRTMLAARSERIVAEAATRKVPAGRVFDDILRPFGVVERRTMARTFACVAQSVTQGESSPEYSGASAELVESLVPARSTNALVARCVRADNAIRRRRYDEAHALAQPAYSDAVAVGNGRLRATAARTLAAIALGCRRRSEAQQYIREALALGERFSSCEALARTNALARRLDVA